jgi:hypothetical protein
LQRSDSIRNNLNLAPHLELRWLENRNSGCECGRNSRSRPAAGNGLFGRGDRTPKIPPLTRQRTQRPKSGNLAAENPRRNALFGVVPKTCGLRRLDGGRTRARTWDPLIKRQERPHYKRQTSRRDKRSDQPHQIRTRNDRAKAQRTRSISDENARKSTERSFILPLITVWLQVRVLPGPPAFARKASEGCPPKPSAKAGFVRELRLASHLLRPCGLRVAQPTRGVRAKRVRRSLSETKAKTDWN